MIDTRLGPVHLLCSFRGASRCSVGVLNRNTEKSCGDLQQHVIFFLIGVGLQNSCSRLPSASCRGTQGKGDLPPERWLCLGERLLWGTSSLCREPEKGSEPFSSRRHDSPSKLGGSRFGGAGLGDWLLLGSNFSYPLLWETQEERRRAKREESDKQQSSRRRKQRRRLQEALPSLRNWKTEQNLSHMMGSLVPWWPQPQG